MTLAIGQSTEVQGSAAKPYTVKNHDGVVWSCSCVGWRHSSGAVSQKTCKHVVKVRGPSFVQTGTTTGRIQTAQPNIVAKLRPDEKAKLNGPGLLLAHKWDGELDPTGWHVSEKRDGCRAYFDGEDFISRQGNIFRAPTWFKSGLDGVYDGELIQGRGKFSETISIVKSHDSGDAWKKVRFEVFDAPKHGGVFEDRHEFCKSALSGAPHALVLEQVRCEGISHLKEELARIEALGGEGLMLRQPGSLYEIGRSHTLLKVKTFHDTEALITGFVPGRGKYKGITGGLECVLPNGVTFSVGSGLTDALRRKPPAIGTQIVFRYFELDQRSGCPRFPTFLRVYDPL